MTSLMGDILRYLSLIVVIVCGSGDVDAKSLSVGCFQFCRCNSGPSCFLSVFNALCKDVPELVSHILTYCGVVPTRSYLRIIKYL